MNDLKNGDLILCIANLSVYKECDPFIGMVGKITNASVDEEYISSTAYNEKYDKFIRVKFFNYDGIVVLASEEVIKI